MYYGPQHIPGLPHPTAGLQYLHVDFHTRTEGASAHQLIAILYEDLIGVLAVAHLATKRGSTSLLEEKKARALSILFSLEFSLDFERGGEVAQHLGRLYRHLSRQIRSSGMEDGGQGFLAARATLMEIDDAWDQIR